MDRRLRRPRVFPDKRRRRHRVSYEEQMRWYAIWDNLKVTMVIVVISGIVLATLWSDLKSYLATFRADSAPGPSLALTPPVDTPVNASDPQPPVIAAEPPRSQMETTPEVRGADQAPAGAQEAPPTPVLKDLRRMQVKPVRARPKPKIQGDGAARTRAHRDGNEAAGCNLSLEECGFTAPPPRPQSIYEYEVWTWPK
jgi:hypothetical protein